jgi:acetylornithine deacetylase
MKAFLAIAVEAARRARDANLRRPLVILATADEESSMHGAKALVAAGTRLGRQAVIGEPTGLRPVRMHKGILMEGIHVIGRSGHSSNPALGANAIEGLHAVISALVAWRETLARRYRNDAFEVPYPTLNLGHVHGGDNANRICGDCQLHVDLRSLPGMDTNELREELREQVRAALAGTPFRLDFEPLFDGIPALETPAATAIVAAAEALTGEPAGAVAFGTEGPYFRRLGLDTLILGPGDIDLAHQPDEYLDASRIAPTLDLLGRLIERFCGEPVADA